MGLYSYISNEDRITKRKSSDDEVNTEFQEALKHDPSLMIEESYRVLNIGVFRTPKKVTYFSIYHETPAQDGSAYQARFQSSASGSKFVVIAYLHGIINGCIHNSKKWQ